MHGAASHLPNDIETLKRLVLEQRSLIAERDARLAVAQQQTLHLSASCATNPSRTAPTVARC